MNISTAYSQYNAGGTQFYVGPKTGVNLTKFTAGKNLKGVPEAYEYAVGFDAGMMYKFKVTDYISLHGELNFSRRARSVVDSTQQIKFRNNHIDAPILFELNFKAKNKKIGEFEYYFNGGPQISYWLGGKGRTVLIADGNEQVFEYPLVLGKGNNTFPSNANLNRFQYGFILGSGITLPSVGDNFFVIEARYFFGQTYLGDKYTATFGDFTYEDDLRGNYQMFSLSFAYTFGLNFMPSTEKKSGMKVKTVVK